MNSRIEIVDRGRGLQLSTSRITIQDLVPYFQDASTSEEIRRWIPILTEEEIAVAAEYYRGHQAALDKQDQEIRKRSGQQRNSPEIEKIGELGRAKVNALREQFQSQRNGERNGDSTAR